MSQRSVKLDACADIAIDGARRHLDSKSVARRLNRGRQADLIKVGEVPEPVLIEILAERGQGDVKSTKVLVARAPLIRRAVLAADCSLVFDETAFNQPPS